MKPNATLIAQAEPATPMAGTSLGNATPATTAADMPPAVPSTSPSAADAYVDPWAASTSASSASSDWLSLPADAVNAAGADPSATAGGLHLSQLWDGSLPIEAWINQGLGWAVEHLRPFFQTVRAPIDGTLRWVEGLLTSLPTLAMIALIGLLAWQFAGRALAVGTVVSLLIVAMLGIWPEAMVTLSLVLTSLAFCVLIGLPLGILLASSDRAQRFMRPLLDAMQTTPAFVYLVPVVMLFGIGNVPGVVVTIVFALPPLVRLTNLGLRQVRPDLIEASRAYGASPAQMLLKVQLPLAMPSIMAGINQALMLSLSMVVIASMIAVGGLGQMVLRGIGRLDMGLATVGGLGIVLLAITLDRLTQSLGQPRRGVRHWWQTGPAGFVSRWLPARSGAATRKPAAADEPARSAAAAGSAGSAGSALAGVVIAAAAVAALAPAPAQAQAQNLPGKGIAVQPLQSSLAEETFQTVLVNRGLQRLGYTVQPIREIEYATAHVAIANGDATFMANHWDPLQADFYKNAGGDAKLWRKGFYSSNAVQGYLIDRKTAEAHHITRLDQLKDPKIAQLFDTNGDGRADMTGCTPGWGCEGVIEHQLTAFGLRGSVTHVQGSYAALMAETIQRFKQGQPILYYTWTPYWVSSVLRPGQEVVWLQVPHSALPGDQSGIDTQLPNGKNYGFIPNHQRIVANRQFIAANPAAARLFELMQLPVADINAQNLAMRDGQNKPADVERHADGWIRAHQRTFDGWIQQALAAAK